MTLQKTCFLNDPTKPVSKGDLHDNAPNVRKSCEKTERFLVTTQYGSSPHTDDGVDVRRIFHQLRSVAIENFNEPFKGIFDAHGQVPTKGETPTKRFALGAMFVYQVALLYRYQNGFPLRVGQRFDVKSVVNLSAMSDVFNDDLTLRGIYAINHTVIPRAKSVCF